MVMSLWPRFLAYPVGCANTAALQQHADRIGVGVFGSYQVFWMNKTHTPEYSLDCDWNIRKVRQKIPVYYEA